MTLPPLRWPQRFFAAVGFTIVCAIVVPLLLELGAFLIWHAYHRIRPSSEENFADTSPAYAAYPWAAEYWKEEKSRWKSQRGQYQPFRIWGVAPWHSQYVNTDDTATGTWRRTINVSSPACERQPRVDVWMFGGSTLFGTGVPDPETIPSLLSRDLNAANRGCFVVMNFGAEGYVTNQEVILLMELLKAGRRPGLVIFYDGMNDAYAGAVSPRTPTAHLSLSLIKARVEGSLPSRLDFLRNSYALLLARELTASFHQSANSSPGNIGPLAAAAIDNYEANLRIVRILAQAYGFRAFCFWQPALAYGEKPLDPFEQKIERTDIARSSFPALSAVFQRAERRAAADHTFIFLGHIFDSVKSPVYIDSWMHLAPAGNELVAGSIAKIVEACPDQQ